MGEAPDGEARKRPCARSAMLSSLSQPLAAPFPTDRGASSRGRSIRRRQSGATTGPSRSGQKTPPDAAILKPVLASARLTAASLRLLAGVPEALLPARVGVVPAQARPGRRSGPRGRGRRADKAKRRAGRNGAARSPAITGTGPTAIAINPTGTIGAATVRAATVSAAPIGAATVSTTP